MFMHQVWKWERLSGKASWKSNIPQGQDYLKEWDVQQKWV